jgi:Domain of Unknown Function (DUF1259)
MSRGLHLAAAIVALGLSSPVFAADIDWKKVEDALGKAGAAQPDGVYRVGLPRSDLKVTLDGVEIRPALALGSWLAFEPAGDSAMVMGDLVLTQDEVNPVMKSLVEGGIEITALHNHLLRSSPATMYMHVEGHGDPVKLATTLHTALALSGTPFATPNASGSPPTIDLDTAQLDEVIGQKGKANGGVYQFTVARAEPISDAGMAVPRSMGTGIAINFQPTGGGKAAITGDFVLIASEVNPVLLALREHGIEVTALHNHMLNDEPRLFFMHFWANADAQALARGLRAALDQMNLKKS